MFESREMTCKQKPSGNQPKIESEGKTNTRKLNKIFENKKSPPEIKFKI